MAHAKFEKVGQTDKPLYGPRKLLLCGFPAGAQPKFEAVLKMVGLTAVPKRWIDKASADQLIKDLLALDDETGAGVSSALPRAIIVGGLTEKELMRLMAVCKKTGMANALWATLTPTSENWTVKQLLAELAAERKEMQKRR
jgi:hypothetical protein